jgi:N-acylneuraminate cytidylyltransferase
MVEQTEVLAIIPARGGSKGIPRKNILSFAGKPLITYSIAAGLQSELVTRVIVSTDDAEIAAVARQYGAEVPFMRPAELARDQTLDLPVFEHALQWFAENEGYHPQIVVQLRPTSPVRPRSCVDDAVRLLLARPEADSVRGVVPAGQNPHKMWEIDEESGLMIPLLAVEGVQEPFNAPRQILPPVYWQTGHIDAIRPAVILERHSMSGEVILPLLIDPLYTVDLDNLRDWARAEWLVLQEHLDMVHPGVRKRCLPEHITMIVFDFDGVLTDNRVWVDEQGQESVASYRSDGIGLARLREKGIEMVVISSETNPVVAARCKKLGLPVVQGVQDKATVLRNHLVENGVSPNKVVYVGNDINDVPCFRDVGCAVVVADAHPDALSAADIILERRGGYGAVRELCDLIANKMEKA